MNAEPICYGGVVAHTFNIVRETREIDPFMEAERITRHVFQKLKVAYNLRNQPSRLREIVQARQISMYLINKHVELSLKQIGEIFNRDHSTVIYARETVEDLIFADREFKILVKQLEIQLQLA